MNMSALYDTDEVQFDEAAEIHSKQKATHQCINGDSNRTATDLLFLLIDMCICCCLLCLLPPA